MLYIIRIFCVRVVVKALSSLFSAQQYSRAAVKLFRNAVIHIQYEYMWSW